MKVYTVVANRYRGDERISHEYKGTLEQLIDKFSYTLEVGKSWENERGNKKINRQPKTARSLVDNLNKAVSNSAANGCASTYYELA